MLHRAAAAQKRLVGKQQQCTKPLLAKQVSSVLLPHIKQTSISNT
jgi:hypothetical protein